MRLKINIMSWVVFLGLLIHMAEGRRPANKYIIAKRTDHTVKWMGI